MLSSFVSTVLAYRRIRKVYPSIVNAVDDLVDRARRLVKLEREHAILQQEHAALKRRAVATLETMQDYGRKYAAAAADLKEAERLISTNTAELELLRSIVDGESPGLSERITNASAALVTVLDSAEHLHG